jgi:cell division ATPase FtsA
MSIFSEAKEKKELILVFNIGSSAVGGALFQVQTSGIPKIISSVAETIPVEEKNDIDRLLVLTIQSLETVAKKIYNARLGAPKQIFCVLSSPWYVSQTRMISLKKNTPFIFTAKLADELVQKEIKIFEEENLAKYGPSVRAIELKNIKTILNGYETSSPLNQKAKELEMTIFVSIGGEQVLKNIEDTINKHFHTGSVKFCSFAMASFAVVRDTYPKQENFLLVDIGGEVTDIFMVKKNALRESISFPFGCNFLMREAASGLGATLNETNSMISLLKDGHIEENLAKKNTPILEKLRTEWLQKFQESLSNLSGDISIPSNFYLTADKEMADFFLETIKNEQFNQYTLAESKFEVVLLNTETLHGVAIFEEGTIREPSLIIDAVYINRFLSHK